MDETDRITIKVIANKPGIEMVLRPLSLGELTDFFDQDAKKIFEYFISKSIFSQPEPLPGQSDLPVHIPKEHIEQWTVQALGANPVGSGSYPVDVVHDDGWGADVKMLSCKTDSNGNLTNGESGETSLAQKFNYVNDLDSLFISGNFDQILNSWIEILRDKYSRVIRDRSIKRIFYFFILRANLKFHLCGLQFNIENLESCWAGRTTGSSVFVENFIDDNLGSIKIYKAKKRMELRLRPRNWFHSNLLMTFDISNMPSPIKLRELVEDHEKFVQYKKRIIISIFDID